MFFRDKAGDLAHAVAKDCGIPPRRQDPEAKDKFFKLYCSEALAPQRQQYDAVLRTSLSAHGLDYSEWELLCMYRDAGKTTFHADLSKDDLDTYMSAHPTIVLKYDGEPFDFKPLFYALRMYEASERT